MKKRKLKKSVKIFLLVIVLLIITLLIIPKKPKEQELIKERVQQVSINLEEKEILNETDNFNINVKYPYYNNKDIDNIINLFIMKLNYNITQHKEYNKLKVSYEIYGIEHYDYIVFKINSTIDKSIKYKTFLVDTKNYKVNEYENILDLEKLKTKIKTKLQNKYSETILNGIEKSDFNNLNYLLNKDGLTIYFNELKTTSMSYIPVIELTNKELKNILKYEISFTKEYEKESVKKDKLIALTFDDGPGEYTNEILDILKEYNAKVTFFVVGNRINRYPSIIKRELNENHEIASHTYSHKDLVTIKDSEVLSQINSTNTAFKNLTGKNIKYVRPPYGSYNDKVKSLVEHPLILWNVDSKDWEYLNSKKTSNWVLKKVFDGSIVLMHDIHQTNIEALKIMLPELEARGYKFVTISTMAKENNVTLEKGKSYRYIE